jgi:hypothetical protein
VLIASAWLLCGSLNAAEKPKYTQEHLDNLFQEAIMLSQVGMYEEAEARCKKILSQMPDQPTVKKLLEDLQEKKMRGRKPDPSAELKKELDRIVLPVVEFREAAITDVIAFLREESKKHTKDKTEINFVVLLPEGKAPTVTMSLKKIPLMEVLRYITVLTGLQYQIDPHAVVISPPLKFAPAKSNANAP